MGKNSELSGEGEGVKVFGQPSPRRHTRPASYWLKAGLLAFIGVLNLVAALGLLAAGVYLLSTDKVEGDTSKAELRVGGLALRARIESPGITEAAAQQQGREALAALCLALSFVPFSLAVLARLQYQVCKEMALLPRIPVGGAQQNE